MTKKFKSCALWSKGTFDSQENYTEDCHDTREQADGVCQLLATKGAGGEGKSFPITTWVEEISERADRIYKEPSIEDGISLRDYFAAKALQGCCAADVTDKYPAALLAKVSYEIADAMLEARKKP